MKITIAAGILLAAGLLAGTSPVKFTHPFVEDFSDSTLTWFRYGSTGTQADFKFHSGVRSKDESGTKVLSLKLDPQERAGAGRGPEIISKEFTHFGTYAARLKIPDVRKTQPNTGAVVGYFTYNMDSIRGLSEIDVEFLVADPSIIYIGTWTGPRGKLQRVGRTLNLRSGNIYATEHHEGYTGPRIPFTGEQAEPKTIPAVENFDASSQFYTYGFDWLPDHIRWWMIHPVTGDTVVLWNYHGSPLGLPPNPSYYRLNFWHTKDWAVEGNPNSLEPPKEPYELQADWMSYEPR